LTETAFVFGHAPNIVIAFPSASDPLAGDGANASLEKHAH
jgi:hypothetical protein